MGQPGLVSDTRGDCGPSGRTYRHMTRILSADSPHQRNKYRRHNSSGSCPCTESSAVHAFSEVDEETLNTVNRGTIECTLMCCISVWSDQEPEESLDWKSLQREVETYHLDFTPSHPGNCKEKKSAAWPSLENSHIRLWTVGAHGIRKGVLQSTEQNVRVQKQPLLMCHKTVELSVTPPPPHALHYTGLFQIISSSVTGVQ